MFELFSQRIKNSEGEPEVYIYDIFSEQFRNQLFYIVDDAIDPYRRDELWTAIHDTFAREKGLKTLYSINYDERSNIENFISSSNNLDLLDLIDYIFHQIDTICRKKQPTYNPFPNLKARADQLIDELNNRLKQHNLGYEFTNGEIVRIDNKILHQTAVKPSLKLLYENGFEGAEQEFLHAFNRGSVNNFVFSGSPG
jgi:hypothetical protein